MEEPFVSQTYPVIPLLTQTIAELDFPMTPRFFWLATGVLLCLTEFILPHFIRKKIKLVSLLMGVSALIEAFILWRGSRWLVQWQIMYWMGLSLALILWVRPVLMNQKKYTISEASEAKTLTEILPGEVGRVLYEGCSWQALCQDSQITIPAHKKVYVLRREGNTLIVVPQPLFNS